MLEDWSFQNVLLYLFFTAITYAIAFAPAVFIRKHRGRPLTKVITGVKFKDGVEVTELDLVAA
jgi:hypothetical protein